MSADNRTTHTDAVATLGTIIDETQHRDAIHLATEPVIADQKLFPGQDVGLDQFGRASTANVKMVGIVDPFLKAPVMPGERFWLIVYPRTITTLRHTWEHPDFKAVTQVATQPAEELSDAERYLRNFAACSGIDFFKLLIACRDDEGSDSVYIYDKGYVDLPEDFWQNYNEVTGRKVALWGGYIDDGCRGC